MEIVRTRFLALGLAFCAGAVLAHANPFDLGPAVRAVAAFEARKAATPKAALNGFMQDATPPPNKRALPSPLQSPPMPFTEWANEGFSPIGDDWTSGTGILQKALFGKRADSSKVKVYGWFDFGYNFSTSDHNNSPLSYDFVPNRPELDQAVVRVEKMVDTTQNDHPDWGFRVDAIYGEDYRFTAADGWWFSQWQQHNQLYGGDAPEVYLQYYFPKIAQGAVLTVGRYISPCDIEAQLSPYNYTYSHSLMFTVDPYTYTGANMEIRWSKNWQTLTGIQAGNDKTPWEKSGQANAELLVGYHNDANTDAWWFGSDSIGGGHYQYGHDDLQIASVVWGHKFNDRLHQQMQMYYMWERDAELGGTENDGPIEPYGAGGGPTEVIPGQSHANGYVTYWQYQSDKSSYWSARFDLLNDPEGYRTGVPDSLYTSYTLAYVKWLTQTITVRPELRFDNCNKDSYDNGTRKTQWTLAGDIIIHF